MDGAASGHGDDAGKASATRAPARPLSPRQPLSKWRDLNVVRPLSKRAMLVRISSALLVQTKE